MSDKAIQLDNGANTVTVDEDAVDNRHVASGKAKAIVDAIMKSESAIAVTAKEWGAALLSSAITDNVSLDMLIGESKLAAGFATLGVSDAGKKAKQRLNTYFSNARLVMERFSTLSDEQKEAVLTGKTSIHYLAGLFRDADRKAEAEAKKAAAAGEAAADSAAAGTEGETAPVPTMTELATLLLNRWNEASDEEKEAALDAMALLVDTVNAGTEETGETELVELAA